MRDQMQEFIKEHHEDIKQDEEERNEINKFVTKPEVEQVFETYKNSLSQMHKFYSS